MPDAVKVSELPFRAAVTTDLLPAIDQNFGQTVRLRAQDIAALGGGPPGDNTVATAKLVNGAVTYPKIQNVAQDSILGRSSSGAGVVEEIACTPFARTVLAAATSAQAVTALGALASTVDPTFTGAVKLPDGTEGAPSLTNTNNQDCGIFFPYESTIGISTNGYERFRIGSDGTQYANYPGTGISRQLRPHFLVRAYVLFNGTGAGSTIIKNQHTIAERYVGVWGSIRNDAASIAKIKALEDPTGSGPTYISATGTSGTEDRDTWTTPNDNGHYYWNGSQWEFEKPAQGFWIGNITLTNRANVGVLNSGNIASVAQAAAGVYDITFVSPMPDVNYTVIAMPVQSDGVATNPHVARVVSKTTTGFRVTSTIMNGGSAAHAVVNVDQFSVVVVR